MSRPKGAKHKIYLNAENEKVFKELSEATGLPIPTLIRLMIDNADLKGIWEAFKPLVKEKAESGQISIYDALAEAKE